MALDSATEPFSSGTIAMNGVTAAAITPTPALEWSALLALIWLAGSAFLAVRWIRHWLYLRGIARAATPIAIDAPMPVKSSPSLLEPGLVDRPPDPSFAGRRRQSAVRDRVWRRLSRMKYVIGGAGTTLQRLCTWLWRHCLSFTRWFGGWVCALDCGARECVRRGGSILRQRPANLCREHSEGLPNSMCIRRSRARPGYPALISRKIEAIMESKFAIRLNAARRVFWLPALPPRLPRRSL